MSDRSRICVLGKTLLPIALVVLASAGAYAQSGGSATDNQILQIVNGLRNTANTQTTLLNNLQLSSNNQQTSLTTLQTLLATLQNTANTQQANLTSLQTSLTSLQAAVTSLQSTVNTLQSAVNRIPTEPRKKFYLTLGGFTGANALNACAAGYHMASLWEIFDVSGLKYDTSILDSFTSADSGRGPSSIGSGWVRTGWRDGGTSGSFPGSSNCSTWTSADGADHGTTIELNNQWDESPNNQNPAINPWRAFATNCDQRPGVWCKQD